MEINEIIKLSEEKTNKVCASMRNGIFYDNINDDIEFIFECAFDKRKSVWDYCSCGIFELAELSSEVCERILNVMKTGSIQERFIIACSLRKTDNLDKDFFEKIIYSAIRDKSKKVKLFGAQQADRYNLYKFADLIKEESEIAEDKALKEGLTDRYIYLTKGYKIIKTNIEDEELICFRDGTRPIPKEIKTEEDKHKYVITEYKDRPRIKDLYYKNKK